MTLSTTPGCCAAWDRNRSHFAWLGVDGLPGVYVMPAVGDTTLRFCPYCGRRVGQPVLNLTEAQQEAA